MENKKAAKKIIKRAKKHPDWYTQEEVLYAKLLKRELKKNECKTDLSNAWRRVHNGIRGTCVESKQSGKS